MEMRSLRNEQLRIGDYLKREWYFSRWWDKTIIVVLGWLGVWKLIDLIRLYIF